MIKSRYYEIKSCYYDFSKSLLRDKTSILRDIAFYIPLYTEAHLRPTQQINTVNDKYKQKYQIFQSIKHQLKTIEQRKTINIIAK